MVLNVINTYKVPKKQWNKWSDDARYVFNEMMFTMDIQDLFRHPLAYVQTEDHWMTTRWNAAWTAANLVDDLLYKL